MNLLIQLDHTIFLLINHLPHTYLLNSYFAFLSGVGRLGLIWICIGMMLYFTGELRDKKIIFSLFFAVVLSYIFTDITLKHLFSRLRPEITLSNAIVIWDNASSYSFPSGHATVSFAAAFVMSHSHKRIHWLYFMLAALVGFSRIYLGKHYPSDVLAGALCGLGIGYLVIKITDKIFKKKVQ